MQRRFRIYATTTTASRQEVLRAAGAVPLVAHLDARHTLRRLGGLAKQLIYLAPPEQNGSGDPRVTRLWLALRGHLRGGCAAAVQRRARKRRPTFVYASTTGVYGDHGGGRVNETTPTAAATARAKRRVDAERRAREVGASVLRIPGIYAHDRLPLQRLRQSLPVLVTHQDVLTNHIHADDLARAAIRALTHARRKRIYNVVDDSQLRMGDFMDLVADRFALPRPPRLERTTIAEQLSPAMLSFINESRSIDNRRLKRELKLHLAWPSVEHTLRSIATETQ